MYRAKRDRPGTYRIFDEAMRGDVLGRINVAGELRAAVRARRSRHRLPADRRPRAPARWSAMEALARWTNEAGERVPPDVFIPVAEETGIIGELGRVVLPARSARPPAGSTSARIGVRVNASATSCAA